MKIQTVFSDKFAANTPTPSMRKLEPVARAAEAAGLAQLQSPDNAHLLGVVTRLNAIHDPQYVEAFVTGRGRLASSNGFPWTPAIRDGVLAMNAGMLTGARLAMAHGVACAVAQGAHHAHPEHGGGFCTFNSFALVANEAPGRRVFVLDCDEHGGDGTAAFAKRMDNLFNYSVCGSPFGAGQHGRSVVDRVQLDGIFKPYSDALFRAFKAADQFKPGLVIYNAGCDPHVGDPLGSVGLTQTMIRLRDKMVFDHFKKAGIPVLWALAGGYNRDMNFLVGLHLEAFRAAQDVWR